MELKETDLLFCVGDFVCKFNQSKSFASHSVKVQVILDFHY